MKSLVVLSIVLAYSLPSFARTQSIFSGDGSKATVLVMGMAGDNDALGLYDSLAVPEQILDGKRTKRLNFDGAGGERAFSVVCVLSGLIAESGTCTVILNASSNTTIDKGLGEAHFLSVDSGELTSLQGLFVIPAGTGLIYASSDRKLQLSVSREAGLVNSFEILYR